MASPIGFIGLGQMGGRMLQNLVKKGRTVVAYDVVPASLAAATDAGAKSAATVAEVARNCETIITMLPSNPHVTEVYLGADGLVPNSSEGSLFIDSSTIDPNVSRTVAKAVNESGSALIDAPVSGGVGGAEAGTLTFMVGGEQAALDRATPVLMDMGTNIVHCGGNGTGEVAKLCNNLALGISMIGTAEAMNLGEKLGMDPKILASVMNSSTARCWSSDTYNPCPGVMEGVPASRGYTGGFANALMEKDLFLAAEAARATGAPLPLGSASHAVYSLMKTQGLGDKDFGSVYLLFSGKNREE